MVAVAVAACGTTNAAQARLPTDAITTGGATRSAPVTPVEPTSPDVQPTVMSAGSTLLVRAAAQEYSDAYLTGDAETAYGFLIRRCQGRIGRATFIRVVHAAGAHHGPVPAVLDDLGRLRGRTKAPQLHLPRRTRDEPERPALGVDAQCLALRRLLIHVRCPDPLVSGTASAHARARETSLCALVPARRWAGRGAGRGVGSGQGESAVGARGCRRAGGCTQIRNGTSESGGPQQNCLYRGHRIIIWTFGHGGNSVTPPLWVERGLTAENLTWVIGCSRSQDCPTIKQSLGGDLEGHAWLGSSILIE